MTFSTIRFPEYPRAEIRAHLNDIRQSVGSAMPEAAVDEIADLACFAAQSARQAMFRVLDSASHQALGGTAIGIAASLVASDMKAVEQGLRAYSQQSGAPFFEKRVTVGGQAHG